MCTIMSSGSGSSGSGGGGVSIFYTDSIVCVCYIGALISNISNSLLHEVVGNTGAVTSNHRNLYNTHTYHTTTLTYIIFNIVVIRYDMM